MTEKPLKAYSCYDGDECWVTVFATNGATARRLGANEMDCDFEQVESCKRIKWADEYAPGPIPKLALIEHNWWFECSGCYRQIRDDYYDDEDDREMKPVEYGNDIYCCEECRQRHFSDRTRRKKAEDDVKEALSALVLHRYPEAGIHTEHAYVGEIDGWYQVKDAYVAFKFPDCCYFGAKLKVTLDNPEPVIYVANGDMPAWEAYLGRN